MTDTTAAPTMTCPKCSAVYDDHDGFGVLHCEKCGYCTHAVRTNGVCDLCGHHCVNTDTTYAD